MTNPYDSNELQEACNVISDSLLHRAITHLASKTPYSELDEDIKRIEDFVALFDDSLLIRCEARAFAFDWCLSQLRQIGFELMKKSTRMMYKDVFRSFSEYRPTELLLNLIYKCLRVIDDNCSCEDDHIDCIVGQLMHKIPILAFETLTGFPVHVFLCILAQFETTPSWQFRRQSRWRVVSDRFIHKRDRSLEVHRAIRHLWMSLPSERSVPFLTRLCAVSKEIHNWVAERLSHKSDLSCLQEVIDRIDFEAERLNVSTPVHSMLLETRQSPNIVRNLLKLARHTGKSNESRSTKIKNILRNLITTCRTALPDSELKRSAFIERFLKEELLNKLADEWYIRHPQSQAFAEQLILCVLLGCDNKEEVLKILVLFIMNSRLAYVINDSIGF
ncbi:hypothetical protein ACOME3_000673 [Neoechinorhynchus agilis]